MAAELEFVTSATLALGVTALCAAGGVLVFVQVPLLGRGLGWTPCAGAVIVRVRGVFVQVPLGLALLFLFMRATHCCSCASTPHFVNSRRH
jgi:hypothetical protein